MIRKSMFNFGSPAPMQNSMNFQFGAEESDPLGSFRSRFNVGGDTSESVIPTMAEKVGSNDSKRKFKATEALMDYISQQPKREDHQLGKWGKFGAALTAAATGWNNPLAGIEVGRELRDRPFRQAMDDYATKGQGLKIAADLESDMYGQDLEFQKMFHDWNDKQADNEREDAKLGVSRDELALNKSKYTTEQQQWRDEYELKKEDMIAKGWREFTDKDGNMTLINDNTKEKRNLGPSIAASNLAVARINADAAQTNAAANTTRAGAAVTSANAAAQNATTNASLAPDRKREIESNITKNEQIDPRDELLLQAAAAKELVTEFPGYKKFVNEDGTLTDDFKSGGWFSDDAGITDFAAKLREKLNQLRTRKRGQRVEDKGGVIELPPIPKPGGF